MTSNTVADKLAGFTPGPWQSKHDYTIDGATTIIANVDGELFSDGTETYTYEFICACEDEYGERSPRAQANARLIAAAPDLYRLLDLAVRQYDAVKGGPILGALEAARSVLAKARGEA